MRKLFLFTSRMKIKLNFLFWVWNASQNCITSSKVLLDFVLLMIRDSQKKECCIWFRSNCKKLLFLISSFFICASESVIVSEKATIIGFFIKKLSSHSKIAFFCDINCAIFLFHLTNLLIHVHNLRFICAWVKLIV